MVGLGFGLTFGLLPRVGLRALPDADAGQGSGVINVCLYIGFTFGIAACGVVVDKIRHDAVQATVAGLTSGPKDRSQVILDLAHGSNSAIERAVMTFNDADAASIKSALTGALEGGFSGAMTLLAVASAVGAVFWRVALAGSNGQRCNDGGFHMTEGTFAQEDIDTIIGVFQETLLDIPHEDFDNWLAQWTEDARLMPPDMADVVGHDALRRWMREWPKIKRFEVIDNEVEGDGNLAILISHFIRVLEAPDGGEIMQPGRQVLKFRRQSDGRWLIAAAIFNSDKQSA